MSTTETPSKGKSSKKMEDTEENALLLAAGELTAGDITKDGKLRYLGGTLFEEVR